MRDLEKMPLRELQTLSARALSAIVADNNSIWKFNSVAHHNSQNWYRAVITWYVDQYGGWPDEVGPGTQVRLMLDE